MFEVKSTCLKLNISVLSISTRTRNQLFPQINTRAKDLTRLCERGLSFRLSLPVKCV